MATFTTGQVSATPNVNQNALTTNFTSIIDFAGTPHLPDVYSEQVHRYGNRTISGFLKMTGAEYALQSDEVRWTEQGRLHLRYDGVGRDNTANLQNTFVFPTGHGARVGDVWLFVGADSSSTATFGDETLGRVTAVSGTTVTALSYKSTAANQGFADLPSSANGAVSGTTGAITAIKVGSEFGKGTTGMTHSLETDYTDRVNNPVILKDKFSVSGSDAAQIGWIEVTDENGGGHGYLWYLQSEIDTRTRFMDYVETYLVESRPAAAGSPAATATANAAQGLVGGLKGSEGLFYVLEEEGNTATGGFNDTSASTGRADFDGIVTRLDAQGNIQENLLYLNREESLAIDNILAQQNSYGASGTSYGAFNNSEQMALNLGFSGWKRGSYSFYKTDWKYLNDYVSRAAIGTTSSGAAVNNIQGVLVPAGSSSVYDQGMGGSIKRPMLHVRYRAAEGENRKLKNWVTGSVGGVYTSDSDTMDVHYLSERCLVTQAPNNFFLFKRAA